MKTFKIVAGLFLVAVIISLCYNFLIKKKPQTEKSPPKTETYYVQMDPSWPGDTPLLKEPDGKFELTRIPPGEILEREETEVIKYHPRNAVAWYKVTYKSYTGWISEHVTTRKLLRKYNYIITEEQGEIPLRDKIGEGHQTISYIPGGIKLEVLETKKVQNDYLGELIYYKVNYLMHTGWIVAQETTGKVLTEIK